MPVQMAEMDVSLDVHLNVHLKIWRGIMDKNVLRSFCVVHYIVPAVMYPVMLNTTRCATVSHPICRFIVTLMPLHRTLCCYIVHGDAISYRSCYYIVPYAAMSYRSCYYIVPYAAISYTVMLCRTAHAISYLVSVKLVSGFHLKLAQNGHHVISRPFPEASEKQTTTQKE